MKLLCGVIFTSISARYTTLASQAAGQETLIGLVGRDFILIGADSSVSQGFALTTSNLDKIAPLVEPFDYNDRDIERSVSQQQCIVAAAAGDAAMSDRLIGLLKAQATIREFEAGVGCDVEFRNGKASVEPGITVEGMAYLARTQLASIRPGANVCLLIAGMMESPPELQLVTTPFLSQQVQNQVRQAWKTPSKAVESEIDVSVPPSEAEASILRPHLYWLDELGSLQKIQYGAHGLGSNFCLSILDQRYCHDMSLEQATMLMKDCFEQLGTRYLINSPQPPCIKCVDAMGIRLIRDT